MPISESMVKDIVQEVMAKMQIADAPGGKLGIFKDMNDLLQLCRSIKLHICPFSFRISSYFQVHFFLLVL